MQTGLYFKVPLKTCLPCRNAELVTTIISKFTLNLSNSKWKKHQLITVITPPKSPRQISVELLVLSGQVLIGIDVSQFFDSSFLLASSRREKNSLQHAYLTHADQAHVTKYCTHTACLARCRWTGSFLETNLWHKRLHAIIQQWELWKSKRYRSLLVHYNRRNSRTETLIWTVATSTEL